MIGVDPDIDDARAVLCWLATERCDAFTARTCYQHFNIRWPRMADLLPALDLLEERGIHPPPAADRAGETGAPVAGVRGSPDDMGGVSHGRETLTQYSH